jgi:hypothetical protein
VDEASIFLRIEGSGDDQEKEFMFTLKSGTLHVQGLRFPVVSGASDAKEYAEKRIDDLSRFRSILSTLYGEFCAVRFSAAWSGEVDQIREWVASK